MSSDNGFSNIPVTLLKDSFEMGLRSKGHPCLLGDLSDGAYFAGSIWSGAYVEGTKGRKALTLDELGPHLADISNRIPRARHYVWANGVIN